MHFQKRCTQTGLVFLLPDDHSRVVLENTPENPYLDYINANYLDGYNHKKKYIASQGPTTHMINDFVRMIMEKKCDKVIMVTKDFEMGKMKCLIYWPDDKPITKGDITLTLKNQKIRANYTIRTILMTKVSINLQGDSSHTFTQFHYEAWPDHDVPDVHDMLDFLYEVNRHQPQSTAPQVVHCSAGVGRTGTYIAVDYCLEQYKDIGSVDIMICIKKLRNQRRGMVQTVVRSSF
ncbi:hypothetical protein LOTGIDRAFT_129302 [Lottia gigantea]|uniref:Protein-tyrosine-phosphatase n=1 Tax=Lottia gigantea TaxID=225164 RepID=V3ZQ51_LOTGI|nr:hypothetical protein LOTGIDRAFT_129302 [Lottia gigantea]ESO86462.1 hypothetical protein LOTGIDRAFT_129302 [Lottia gigantea]